MTLFFENVRLAFQSLRANKMRSLLTMLGIIIGISSVIAIVTVGDSITSAVSDSMLSMGANNVNVYIDFKEEHDEMTEEGYIFEKDKNTRKFDSEDFFTDEMIRDFKNEYSDEIYAISLSCEALQGSASNGKQSANVSVTGYSAGGLVEKDPQIVAGRLFTADELKEGRLLCLISEKCAEKLYGDSESAVGQSFSVAGEGKEKTFTVVGVYKAADVNGAMALMMMGSFNMSTEVYIPLKAAQVIKHYDTYTNFSVITKQGVDPNEFAKKTQAFFGSYYRNHKVLDAKAMCLASVTEKMSDMMSKVTLAISVIAGIALLVGGIGVMNIMLVSITERTREIGTRKALGAPNSSIRTQFIVEAVVICLIGGAIGVSLGIGLGMLAAKLMSAAAVPSIKSILISLIFSMAIGVFFGYYPANKAAKMDPIEALRYE